MNTWKEIELQSVSREITVGHVGPMADEYIDNGILFLRSQNILPFNLNLDMDQVRYISPDFDKKLSKSKLYPGDIAIVRTGYPGTACVIPSGLGEINCSDLVIVRPEYSKVDSKFLCYYINSPLGRGAIFGSLVGVAQQHFNVGTAKRMKMKLPPLPLQQKIASILSAYDDLIENNKQRIKLLEEMAEEIYKEWFVRFRFPGYESTRFFDEKGKEVPHGTPGALPEGWEKTSAEKLFDINIGKTPPREESQWFTSGNNGVKWVSIRDIGHCNVFLSDTSEEITHEGISRFKMRLAKRDTIILSFKLTVGQLAILNEDVVTNEAIAHFNINASSGLNREYTYCYLKNFQFAELGNTSSIGNAVNSKIVKAMPFIYPQPSLLANFKDVVEPMFEQIRTLGMKNQVLKQTRDLLLPRLISGKLSVEHLVEQELEPMSLAAEPEPIYSK